MTELQEAFQGTGTQLDRIIDALERKKPADLSKTRVYLKDGTIEERDVVGTFTYEFWDADGGRNPKYYNSQTGECLVNTIELGNTVTAVADGGLIYLAVPDVVIPKSVVSIEDGSLGGPGTINITFLERTKAEANHLYFFYAWVNSDTVVHCTDGDMGWDDFPTTPET